MTIQFTKDDMEAFRLIVREEIAKSKEPKEELMSRDELCAKLNIHKSTYHKQVKDGRLKIKKVGNKVAIIA